MQAEPKFQAPPPPSERFWLWLRLQPSKIAGLWLHRQARRQILVAMGAKNQKGGHIFKIQYWIYAATGEPNVKWGGADFKWGGRAPLAPAGDDLSTHLATTCPQTWPPIDV